MDLSKISVDENKIDGTWVNIDERTSLKIGIIGGPYHKRVSRDLVKEHKKVLRTLRLDDHASEVEEIEVKALSKAILLDWKGLTIDGEEVPYSEEKAYEILKNPRYMVFRSLIEDLGADNANFAEEYKKELEGNS